MLGNLKIMEFGKGEYIFRKGDKGGFACVVLKGKIKFYDHKRIVEIDVVEP